MKKFFLLSFISVFIGFTGLLLLAGSAHAKKTAMPPSCNAAVQIFPGDGADDGPALDYWDNLDGTFTDCNTKYMWEIKDDNGGIHDEDNIYTWTVNSPNPTGTPFTVFLDALNNTCDGAEVNDCETDADCVGPEVCGFAGYQDWRIPNVKELQSIVDYSVPTPSSSVPGETRSSSYWSATTVAFFTSNAWNVNFSNGVVSFNNKNFAHFARAVRP